MTVIFFLVKGVFFQKIAYFSLCTQIVRCPGLGGGENSLFGFCLKMHENERIGLSGEGAHVPSAPLGSANGTIHVSCDVCDR